MIRWRIAIAAILSIVLAVPMAAPVRLLASDPSAWQSWTEASRLLALASNTLSLVAGSLLLSVPLGILAAVLLYRTDLPCRRLLRSALVLTLFVPLPLFASGWQTVLGSGGWLPVPAWSGFASVWTPWGQGIGSAIWIHAAAALPWVVLLAGRGLLWIERELEEDALTLMPAGLVLLRVCLPRAGAALALAAAWVGLQAATEITVTDVMQVRTFAEEVYTQIVGGPELEEGIARATAAALPFVFLSVLVVVVLVRWWERRAPAPRSTEASTLDNPPLFPLGRWRWPLALGIALLTAILVGSPWGSLIWRAGWTGTPPTWSASTAGHYLLLARKPPDGQILRDSLLLAVAAGVVASALALVACWAARESFWFRYGVLILMATAWAMPGPLIGLGLKSTIEWLLNATEWRWLAQALYHGPSVLPLLWVDIIRFFSFAVALLWPAMQRIPSERIDAARVDGATPLRELCRVIWPSVRAVFACASLAVAVLSLGEVSAGKIVATPGMPSYATDIFTQMHYGVTNELAARCLVLLLLAMVGGTGVVVLGSLARRRG